MSKTTSVRLDDATTRQLDALALATDRPKAWHLERAIRSYIESEAAFIEAVQRGRAQARAGEGRDFEDYAADLQQRINARLAH
jgi:predicted transcriptional regulator